MTAPHQVVDRLAVALDHHDLDALAGCFAVDYRNETPAHPARGFVGRDQVRRNWEGLFGGLPDLTGEILASVTDGPVVWTEWEMRGTRPDGTRHRMRGVVVFTVDGDEITAARFYLEPVDGDSGDVDAAIEQIVAPEPRS